MQSSTHSGFLDRLDHRLRRDLPPQLRPHRRMPRAAPVIHAPVTSVALIDRIPRRALCATNR
jgi:hypothetical protein